MSPVAQNILGILILIGVFILSRYGLAWQMRRAARRVVLELKQAQATSPDSAVNLPWAKPNWLKFGLRDFRPKVLNQMVVAGQVGVTPQGAYYLIMEPVV